MSLCLSKTSLCGQTLVAHFTAAKHLNFFNCNEDKVSAQQKLLQP